jgi:Polyketide cyclase / dehydrase and lipid transport
VQLGTSFTTRADPASAYAYLADFSRIVEWDPFVVRADALDDGEPRVGSRYRIVGRPLGREITLDYRCC